LNEPEPALSVVVAATAPAPAAALTVASLGGPRHDVEVLVVGDPGRCLDGLVPGPGVEVIAVDSADVPSLRRVGLDRSRGRLVVFTEDSCRLTPGWLDAWSGVFADDRIHAATGPVLPAMGTDPLDWAIYWCEYAPFLSEAGSARTACPTGRLPIRPRLAGNNFAVRRSLAPRLNAERVHEGDVARVAGRAACRTASGAVAGHCRRYGMAEAVRDRLRFGFEYGRRRASALPAVVRPAGFFVGPPVFAAQVARLAATALARGRYPGEFAEATPLTLAMLAAWSVGEWLGWSAAAFGRSTTTCKSGPTARPTH